MCADTLSLTLAISVTLRTFLHGHILQLYMYKMIPTNTVTLLTYDSKKSIAYLQSRSRTQLLNKEKKKNPSSILKHVRYSRNKSRLRSRKSEPKHLTGCLAAHAYTSCRGSKAALNRVGSVVCNSRITHSIVDSVQIHGADRASADTPVGVLPSRQRERAGRIALYVTDDHCAVACAYWGAR